MLVCRRVNTGRDEGQVDANNGRPFMASARGGRR